MTSRQKPRVVRYLGTRPTGSPSPPNKPESSRLQKVQSGSQSDYIETVTEESSSMSSASRNPSEDETTTDVGNVKTNGDGKISFKVLSLKGQPRPPRPLPKTRRKDGRTDKPRPQTHPPEVVQRLLQERAVKITDLKSQVKYLRGKVIEVDEENELLRGVLKKQKAALSNFESPDKYFAKMMQQHKNDVRDLKAEIREESKERDLDKEISERSQQLWETNDQVNRLEQLLEKQLPEMEEGERKVASAENRLLRTTQKISTLEKEIEAATTFGNKRYVAEVVKHRETRESVSIMENECEKIKLKIREREKELEIRNIYHQRLQQARNGTAVSGVSKGTTTDDLREHARRWREAEERERKEAEEKKRREERKRKEKEDMKRLEDAKRKAELEKKKQAEDLERKRQELERMKREKEEKERMEKELRELEERERREKEKKEREERRRRERAEREARERKRREDERIKKLKREKARQQAEEARLAREEAERQARETERLAREEAERLAREEAERKAREEAERLAREEAERQAREEAEEKVRYLQAQLRRVETLIKEKTQETLKKKQHKTKRTFQNLHEGKSSQGHGSSSGASSKTRQNMS